MRVLTPEGPQDFEKYYNFRWRMLRLPWQKPLGSEKDEKEAESCHRMIINDNGEIIGVARLHFEDHHVGVVRYVAVCDKAQGMGVGRLLMETIEALALERGCQKIVLQAREGAVEFYNKLSYQLKTKSHLLYGQIQHFQMSKLLEAQLPREAIELTGTWHNTIPLSKFMAIEVVAYHQDHLVTTSGVTQNKNLHNTMFAGSISTLATLTGWGWCYLSMVANGANGDIVLADGRTRYFKPVSGFAHGVVKLSKQEDTPDFSVLNDGNRVRLHVNVDIMCGDIVCASFTGKYVILPCQNKD
jgi:thioesterase domain-containing protein